MNNTEVKKQDRLDYLEEGKRVRNKLAEDRMKIESIKARKLEEIGHLGIEEKYRAELVKKKIVWVESLFKKSWSTA